MATYIKPGVYIEETLLPTQPIPVNGAVSKAAFIGIADRGPTALTNAGSVVPVATLVRSWSDFLQKFSFGSALPTFTSSVDAKAEDLKYAMKSFFENGGGEAYVVRLVNEDAAKASITFKDANGVNALTIKSNSEGVWGNNVWVTVSDNLLPNYFDIAVYYSEVADDDSDLTSAYLVERFSQLSMNTVNPRYAVNVISSNYIMVEKPAGAAVDAVPYGLAVSTITNKELATNVATLTTSANHLLVAGDTVTVSGVGAPFDGEFVVTAVTTSSPFTFSYAKTATNVTSAAATGSVVKSELSVGQQLSGGSNGVTADSYANILSSLDGVDGPLVLNWANSAGYLSAAVTFKALNTNVATLTAPGHQFLVGDTVVVSGVDATFNGTHTITAVQNTTAPYTFSYAKTASNVSSTAISPNGAAVVYTQGSELIVEASLLYASERRDVFVVVDPVPGASVSEQLNVIENDYDPATKNFGAVYYPQLVVSDPTSRVGGTKTIAPGGAVTALYISADEQKGPQQTPAGVNARVNNAVSVYSLTNSEYSAVASKVTALNIIRFLPGAGIVVMGGRTMSNDNEDKYISVRRSIQYLTRALTNVTQFALFEPNDEVLWGRVRSTIDSFLFGFWNRGGLRGATAAQAYYVKCDSELNTPAVIDAGELRVEVGVALQKPAEFVVIKLGQLDGGTSVTTSL